MKEKRPFVAINVAMTADGKLAPANRQFIPFTTKRDHQLMLELRAQFDAVMSGARTVDLGEVTLESGGEKYRRKRRARGLEGEPIRVIVSGSGTINPKAHIFTARFSPIIILTTERAGKKIKALEKLADAVHISESNELDFRAALQWLQKDWGVKRVLCEGGGAVNSALFQEKVVDEIYLTIAPLIIGGRLAPTMADGAGAERLIDSSQLKLKKMERVGDEIYTVFRVH